MLEDGEELDEEFQQTADEETQSPEPYKEPISTEHQSPSPNKDDLEPSNAKKSADSQDASDSESSSCSETFKPYDNFVAEDNWVKHEEAATSYVYLRGAVEVYAEENAEHKAQTNTTLSHTIDLIDTINKARTSLNALSTQCANISESLKEDPDLREINFPSLQERIIAIENSQVTMQADIYSIKGTDPDAPVLMPFKINGKLYHLTNKEIHAHMELEEQKKKVDQEAKLLALSKSELIKVVTEVTSLHKSQTQEVQSNTVQALKVDSIVMENTCYGKENSNSETASSKSVKESSLNYATKDVHAIKYKIQMTNKYFAEYTGIKVKQFRDTLLQLMGNVKKFVAERTLHQRQCDRRLNKIHIQTQKSKIDTGKVVYVDLVVTESSGTESEVQDDSSRSRNDIDADNADIRPIYDVEPMAEVQLSAECSIFAIGQQYIKPPKIINEGRVDHNKPVEQKSHTQKPIRQIFKGHRFSPNKTSAVYEKTSPRSDLRWKPTGRIFKTVGLRWVPMGKILASYTSKDDSEPTHGSNVDIPNIYESKQTLNLSAGTSINVQKEQNFDLSAELESLFGPLFDEYFNGENQVVSRSSTITTADTSDKRQQQPDLTSSTSTIATTVTVDGNIDI
nr:hypothetical protein [Tanacetum cinerariifolium]